LSLQWLARNEHLAQELATPGWREGKAPT